MQLLDTNRTLHERSRTRCLSQVVSAGSLSVLIACGAPFQGGKGEDAASDDVTPANSGGNGNKDDVTLDPGQEEPNRTDCRDQVELATVVVGGPAPFDVVIVADHSESLSWSREDLARGLGNFLDEVRGHEVRFFVLTPTQYGATSEDSGSVIGDAERVEWRDPETLMAYENAMTVYSRVCEDLAGESIECPQSRDDIDASVRIEGAWEFIEPMPVALITPDMDEAALEEQRAAISNAILSLDLGGASDEQPVCTLQRYIRQDATVLPEHAVFLLIADEDDESSPQDCLVGQFVSVSFQPNRKVAQIQVPGLLERRRFDCTPEDDMGQLTGEPVPMLWNTGAECSTDRACTVEELGLSQDACPTSHRATDCSIECREGIVAACSVEWGSADADPCASPVELDGQSYDNLALGCQALHPGIEEWTDCGSYETGETLGESHRVEALVPVDTMEDMVRDFRDRADEQFGSAGYSVQLIGFDPSFSCEPSTGQSHLDKLRGLVDSPDQVSPICDDYSASLAQVTQFAERLVTTKYELVLEADQSIEGIHVVGQDEVLRSLAPNDYTYDRANGILTIEASALLPTDQALELELAEECEVR